MNSDFKRIIDGIFGGKIPEVVYYDKPEQDELTKGSHNEK